MGKKTNEVLLKHKLITPEQYDAVTAKETAIKEVIEEYGKADKVKASKADFKKMLDKLTQ